MTEEASAGRSGPSPIGTIVCWRDRFADLLFISPLRALARWRGDRFVEHPAGEGLTVRMQVRKGGVLLGFTLVRDPRRFPRLDFTDTQPTCRFRAPFGDWDAVIAFFLDKTLDAPEPWAFDRASGRLVKTDDSECFSLSGAMAARIDGIVRPCLRSRTPSGAAHRREAPT